MLKEIKIKKLSSSPRRRGSIAFWFGLLHTFVIVWHSCGDPINNEYMKHWIPACAGMTVLKEIKN